MKSSLISAICTPLDADEGLHVEGLQAHVEDQWRSGITGILVGGSMGRMQLLADQTYRDLVEHSVRITAGRGELMVGVGDTSFARTRDRIRMVEQLDIDSVVVLTPYFMRYSQEELVDYYRSLADMSRKPLYLYNLPLVTGAELALETVIRVSRHPNIHGIKCSCPLAWARQLMDRVDDRFRIIVANPFMVDMLVRFGVRQQLDGVYSVAPKWAVNIVEAAECGDWDMAARRQVRMTALRRLVPDKYPVDPAFSVILNARGIPGNYGPAPMRRLSEEQRQRLLDEPIVRELVSGATEPTMEIR